MMDAARIIQACVVGADVWLCACARALRAVACVIAGMACTAMSAWLGYIISKRR